MNISKDIETQSDIIEMLYKVVRKDFKPYKDRIFLTTPNMITGATVPIGSHDRMVYFITDVHTGESNALGVAKDINANTVRKAVRKILKRGDSKRAWYEKPSNEVLESQ